jgi:hypothetical protein
MLSSPLFMIFLQYKTCVLRLYYIFYLLLYLKERQEKLFLNILFLMISVNILKYFEMLLHDRIY